MEKLALGNFNKEEEIKEKLKVALDRLEIYFKKREEVLSNPDLSIEERRVTLNGLREEYAQGLNVGEFL